MLFGGFDVECELDSVECWSRAEIATQSRLEMTNLSRLEIANAAADSFLLRI